MPGYATAFDSRCPKKMEAVPDELYSRGKDEELIGIIDTIKDRLTMAVVPKMSPKTHAELLLCNIERPNFKISCPQSDRSIYNLKLSVPSSGLLEACLEL